MSYFSSSRKNGCGRFLWSEELIDCKALRLFRLEADQGERVWGASEVGEGKGDATFLVETPLLGAPRSCTRLSFFGALICQELEAVWDCLQHGW